MTKAASGSALAQRISKVDLREALSEQEVELLKFMFGATAAQTVLIVAFIELLK